MGSRDDDEVIPTPPPRGPALVRPTVGALLLTLSGAAIESCKREPQAVPPMIAPDDGYGDPPMPADSGPPDDDYGDPPMPADSGPPDDLEDSTTGDAVDPPMPGSPPPMPAPMPEPPMPAPESHKAPMPPPR
ncbi:MAG: hypothetical protein H6712_15885 [Myxococcales bacterium]|nr:hypothetical protein [Myxococcales bacterium]MCB9715348.1 hypothetical protein [Myxococcales bacterium]